MKVLGLDTETGGLSPESSSLLTVGAVWADITRKDGVVIEWKKEFRVRQSTYMVSSKAMQVNGLSIADFMDSQDITDIWKEIASHSGRKPRICAHNAAFDLGFLGGIPFASGRQPAHVFDTLVIARTLSAIGLPYGKHTLESCCKYHGIEWDASEAHGALYDACKSVELLQAQLAIVRKGFTADFEAFDASAPLE